MMYICHVYLDSIVISMKNSLGKIRHEIACFRNTSYKDIDM